MDLNYLTIIKEYPDVYEDVVEKGIRSLADYKEHLKTERNMTTGTLSRRVSLVSGEEPFLSSNDDEIIIDKKGAISFISQLAQMIGLLIPDTTMRIPWHFWSSLQNPANSG